VADLGGALGAIAPIPKKFCLYFLVEKLQKYVDITSNGLQSALVHLDRPHS
jgi:hypothetical protein